MMGYTHIAVGCALWAGVRALLPGPPGSLPPELGLAALGSLLPDIDEPQSLVGRKLGFLAWPIKLVFGHRGFTHSLLALGLALAGLAAATGAGLLPVAGATAFWVGYAGHLAGDGLTISGVPLFWPAEARVRAPLAFPTGGVVEHLLAAGLAALLGWVLRGYWPPRLPF